MQASVRGLLPMLHCTLHVVHTWCNTAPSTVWSLCGYVNISCSQASSGQVFSQALQVVAKITKGQFDRYALKPDHKEHVSEGHRYGVNGAVTNITVANGTVANSTVANGAVANCIVPFR